MSLISLIHSGFNHQNGDLTGFNGILCGIYNYPWLYGCVWKWVVNPQIAQFIGKSGPCAGIVPWKTLQGELNYAINTIETILSTPLPCYFAWTRNHPCFSVGFASFAGMRFIDTSRRTNQRASWTLTPRSAGRKSAPNLQMNCAQLVQIGLYVRNALTPDNMNPDKRAGRKKWDELAMTLKTREGGIKLHCSNVHRWAMWGHQTHQSRIGECKPAIACFIRSVEMRFWLRSRSHIYPIWWTNIAMGKSTINGHFQLLC